MSEANVKGSHSLQKGGLLQEAQQESYFMSLSKLTFLALKSVVLYVHPVDAVNTTLSNASSVDLLLNSQLTPVEFFVLIDLHRRCFIHLSSHSSTLRSLNVSKVFEVSLYSLFAILNFPYVRHGNLRMRAWMCWIRKLECTKWKG